MNTEAIASAVAQLSEYDLYLLIDRSGSMDRPVKVGSTRSRWEAAQETTQQIADTMAKVDTDGITVVVFGGSTVRVQENVTGDKVAEVFATNRPSGSTPTDQALTETLRVAAKSAKKDLIVVMTDGVPDDKEALAKVIVAQANRQQADDDTTILFVQVGDDQQATDYLTRLDDGLKGAKFDIVDAKTMAQAEEYSSIEQLLLAAIND